MNTSNSKYAPVATTLEMLKWCPFWVKALLFALLIPTEFSFSLGIIRLTPYRLVLLIAFLPAISRLLTNKSSSILFIDILIFIHIIWAFIVINYYHGLGTAVEAGGIRMLELLGAYLIARTWVTNEKEFRGTVTVIITIITIMAPFALFENITGFHLIKEISSTITGTYFNSLIDDRFGLSRAYVSFDHPILFGVFAASALGITWLRDKSTNKIKKTPRLVVIYTAISSLSSGALAALMTQFTLLIWGHSARKFRSKWRVFTFLLILTYIVVDILSNRSGIKVFLHYLTFSAHTAYNRIIIFEWGIQDVWRNPIMGIGFNEWTRPLWMHSTSMDNFWLLQAVTFGIPGFLTLALAVILMLTNRWKKLPNELVKLRTGWTISMIGMIIAACTVHFWNSIFVYFSFFLGMGGWFHSMKTKTGHENKRN